jgi:riboflavin kinase/FMN adenylyltransferase
MSAVAQLDGSRANAASVIAPGNHDGVHLGHQALVRSARLYASTHGLRAAALTFDPHPAAVLAPDRAPAPLTCLARRRELLLQAGADEVLVQPFSREFASLLPEQFLQALLQRGARALVVGPDFRFGKGRAGDVAMLQRFGQQHALGVIVEPPVMVGSARVSSSAVRESISAGRVEDAASLLGHVHDVSGDIVLGNQRGRTLGFPTANLDSEAVLHPADGVYAVVARVLGREQQVLLRGIASLGVRPTFAAGRSVEVHLFDFQGDLYGERLRVGFVAWVRPQQKFSGVDALRDQIAHDCDAARAKLIAADEVLWRWI